eukprot:CAMPEP_0204353510 /NCGR_PEP_ID=MMETSP0469-20131031/32722_1 /ASSEMBLY_ACC=CAM_ASM_000384 /TAXON_ID=2969 /ORGANISM="Oxyrrhis marina" /LENGTH=631 /DNA_ID=CAMNT_0051340435 /DNA_START=320 /DNA_END=2215 /DNA_ORIENTATION=+
MQMLIGNPSNFNFHMGKVNVNLRAVGTFLGKMEFHGHDEIRQGTAVVHDLTFETVNPTGLSKAKVMAALVKSYIGQDRFFVQFDVEVRDAYVVIAGAKYTIHTSFSCVMPLWFHDYYLPSENVTITSYLGNAAINGLQWYWETKRSPCNPHRVSWWGGLAQLTALWWGVIVVSYSAITITLLYTSYRSILKRWDRARRQRLRQAVRDFRQRGGWRQRSRDVEEEGIELENVPLSQRRRHSLPTSFAGYSQTSFHENMPHPFFTGDSTSSMLLDHMESGDRLGSWIPSAQPSFLRSSQMQSSFGMHRSFPLRLGSDLSTAGPATVPENGPLRSAQQLDDGAASSSLGLGEGASADGAGADRSEDPAGSPRAHEHGCEKAPGGQPAGGPRPGSANNVAPAPVTRPAESSVRAPLGKAESGTRDRAADSQAGAAGASEDKSQETAGEVVQPSVGLPQQVVGGVRHLGRGPDAGLNSPAAAGALGSPVSAARAHLPRESELPMFSPRSEQLQTPEGSVHSVDSFHECGESDEGSPWESDEAGEGVEAGESPAPAEAASSASAGQGQGGDLSSAGAGPAQRVIPSTVGAGAAVPGSRVAVNGRQAELQWDPSGNYHTMVWVQSQETPSDPKTDQPK